MRVDSTAASHLTGPEGHPVVELGPFFLLGIFHLLPSDADCHGAKVFIYSKVVLVLWDSKEQSQGGERRCSIRSRTSPGERHQAAP